MARITPPDNIPTWGTDGGAELTDPGDSKRATGFITGEAPAAGHMNHQLKQIGEWVEAQRKLLAPQMFIKNMTITNDTAFASIGGGVNHCHIRYVDGLSKYIATARTSGTVYAYQSTDGITWSDETAIGSFTSVSKMASDGTDMVWFHYEKGLYTSSTGSVTGITSRGTVGGNLRDDIDVVYDPINDYYVAAGDTEVWTLNNAVDDVHTPGDWVTQAAAFTGSSDGMACSTVTGKVVVVMNGAAGGAYSDDGGQTWTESGSYNYSCPIYSPSAQCFFAYDTANSGLMFAPDKAGSLVWTELQSAAGAGIDADRVLVFEDFLIAVENTNPHTLWCSNSVYNYDGGNPQLNFFELAKHETPDGLGSIVEGDFGGFKSAAPCAVYIIECVGEAPNLVWTRATNEVCYAKLR